MKVLEGPPSIIPGLIGGSYEEKRKDKSFEGSSEEKKCQKFIEKIEGGKKVPHLIPLAVPFLYQIQNETS
jgi:hypothetical protein